MCRFRPTGLLQLHHHRSSTNSRVPKAMSSTRYSQQSPLQIYQDPVTSFDHAPMPSTRPANSRKSSPLRPVKSNASKRNIVFNPPGNGAVKQSPLKAVHQNSSSPSRAPLGNRLNMVTMPPPGGPVYHTDSMEKKQPLMSKFKPPKALFTPITSVRMEKENHPDPNYQQPQSSFANSFPNGTFSLEGLYGQRPTQKRTLLEAAPIYESKPLKKPKMDDSLEGDELNSSQDLPAPDSYPPLTDDGGKPSHSYAQLIGMSILRAPNRRLTLAQIYKWISDTFSFYNATDAGWQNSIRHNLSLNKAFIKQERPKDDPGKGNYWAIQPGMEYQFIKEKEKASRKSTNSNENLPQTFINLAPQSQPESAPFRALTPALHELPPQTTYHPSETQPLPPIPEISSDATIPASDACNPDPETEEAEELPPSSPLIHSSPPIAMMHSSPPVPRHVPRRNDTPPPVPRFPSSSRSRTHKRKFASMDDSGYFSSLDSSAMRPHKVERLRTSEADRPRIKRGRAEEEIARIRGSSYDSPTKARVMSGFAPASSSPLRRSHKHDSSRMLPPLTPIVKLKPPMRLPPTASPNTNLQLHRDRVRELVGSPVRGMTVLGESIPWSPAFTLEAVDENAYLLTDSDFTTAIDIFANANVGLLSVPGNGSPEKRSVKRPRLDRSKSANVLADISNNPFKSVTSTPMLKFKPAQEPGEYNPSMKGLGIMESSPKFQGVESPSKMMSPSFSISFDLPTDEEFYGAEFLSEEFTDFGGMDIMQGFQKIGSGGHSSCSTPKTTSRPTFGRSQTTRF